MRSLASWRLLQPAAAWLLASIMALALVSVQVRSAVAQQKKASSSSATAAAAKADDDFSAVETRVIRFLEEHQRELATILRPLKESNAAEYRRAIGDLDRVSQRLAETRQRDLARYEWELKRWQIQSRIDLLAARWQMTGSEELKDQLREALNERYTINQKLQRLERDRLTERVQKLEGQLEASEGKRAETLDRELRGLVAQGRSGSKSTVGKTPSSNPQPASKSPPAAATNPPKKKSAK